MAQTVSQPAVYANGLMKHYYLAVNQVNRNMRYMEIIMCFQALQKRELHINIHLSLQIKNYIVEFRKPTCILYDTSSFLSGQAVTIHHFNEGS